MKSFTVFLLSNVLFFTSFSNLVVYDSSDDLILDDISENQVEEISFSYDINSEDILHKLIESISEEEMNDDTALINEFLEKEKLEEIRIQKELEEQKRKEAEDAITKKALNDVLWEIGQRNLMLGRFTIPTVGLDVACFHSWEQWVVDAKDSAACYQLGSQWIIGDHVNQGFNKIKSMKVGDKAYFNNGEKIYEFECIKTFTGHNTSKDLTDDNYNSLMDANPNGLTLYTCNGNWRNVYIVFLQLVK